MLTDHASWRWCFYINLPIGAIIFLVVILLLPTDEASSGRFSWKEKLQSMDPLGLLLLVPAILALLLALEWGGSSYAWNSWRVIMLFVLSGILLLIFTGVEIHAQDKATLPPRLICNRNMLGVIWYGAFNYGAMFVFIYYVCRPSVTSSSKTCTRVNYGIVLSCSYLFGSKPSRDSPHRSPVSQPCLPS